MEGIDLFAKILVFVKILSQGRRKEEEEEFQSVEVPEQAPSHLKTGKGPNILANSVQNSDVQKSNWDSGTLYLLMSDDI